jgi:Protein of unknown function (DUF2971)
MTNPARVHDKSHFFKFASIDSAIKIINSKSFIWSSPIKFNDPFDTQTGFTLNYDETTFAKMLCESAIRVIYSEFHLEARNPTKFAQMLILMRGIRSKVPKDKLIADLYLSAIKSAKILADNINVFNIIILEHLLHSRVFCVTEDVSNVVMWSHYAEQHQGIAFRLGCNDKVDNTLLGAKKINYTNDFAAFPQAEEYALHLTGEKIINMPLLIQAIAYEKHVDWSYEKEWRVHIPMLDQPAGTGRNLYPENPLIFEAIYLGCNITEENALKVIALARKELPNMKIYKAMRSKIRYELEFELID